MKTVDIPWPVQTYTDSEGRPFSYVLVEHPGANTLVVHFSAFFGDWGDARPYRQQFGGYFHRLKMLGGEPQHHWLFVCDAYGAHQNGTYYTGSKGDLFVERAMSHIIDGSLHQLGLGADDVITAGSSMGATAALKFGLLGRSRGVVAIAPHIDLDICAARQNRWEEVAFICPDGDPMNPANWPLTRQVSRMVDAWDPGITLPRLFLQSSADDAGVHVEQVLPLLERWRAKGGRVDLDERPAGGHTSDWATKAVLVDVLNRYFEGQPLDITRYQQDPLYRGAITKSPWSHRVRRRLSLTRKSLLRLARRS
jgi:hypothetical protein